MSVIVFINTLPVVFTIRIRAASFVLKTSGWSVYVPSCDNTVPVTQLAPTEPVLTYKLEDVESNKSNLPAGVPTPIPTLPSPLTLNKSAVFAEFLILKAMSVDKAPCALICNLAVGLVVAIPTLPDDNIEILDVVPLAILDTPVESTHNRKEPLTAELTIAIPPLEASILCLTSSLPLVMLVVPIPTLPFKAVVTIESLPM